MLCVRNQLQVKFIVSALGRNHIVRLLIAFAQWDILHLFLEIYLLLLHKYYSYQQYEGFLIYANNRRG